MLDVARAIVAARQHRPFSRTLHLADVIRAEVPRSNDGIDPATLGTDLTDNTDGVVKIHHMHLWCITPGRPMATMHAVLTAEACEIDTVSALRRRLTEHHGIAHITIEVERE